MFLSTNDTSCAQRSHCSISEPVPATFTAATSPCPVGKSGEKLLQVIPAAVGHRKGVLPCHAQLDAGKSNPQCRNQRSQKAAALAGVVWDGKGRSRMLLVRQGLGTLLSTPRLGQSPAQCWLCLLQAQISAAINPRSGALGAAAVAFLALGKGGCLGRQECWLSISS